MLIHNLEHLESSPMLAKLAGGAQTSPISLFINSGQLSLKMGPQEIFKTPLSGLPETVVVSLENVPSYTVSGTSQSSDGAVQSFFSTSGIGSQNNSTIAFTFSSTTVAYPRF